MTDNIRNILFTILRYLLVLVAGGAITITVIVTYEEAKPDDTPTQPLIAEPQAGAQAAYTGNTIVFEGLTNGDCQTERYEIAKNNFRSVHQCWPRDYTLYQLMQNGVGHEDAYTLPIASECMGVECVFDLQNRAGRIGFTHDSIVVEKGKYLLKVYGSVNIPDVDRTGFGVGAFWEVSEGNGKMVLPNNGFPANGDYKAEWLITIPTTMVINITAYAYASYGDLPPWSSISIANIILEQLGD